MTFICETLGLFPPTCSDAPLDWLACDCGPAPGPTPADGHHGEVVPSPRKHPGQDPAGQLSLRDGQAVRRSPLQPEAVVVPGGGTGPRQLYRVIGRALFDGQVGGRLWSWRGKNNSVLILCIINSVHVYLCVLTLLTCASQRWDAIGQFSTVCDDLTAIQPTREQPREHVTCVICSKRLSSQIGFRDVEQNHLKNSETTRFTADAVTPPSI